MKKTLLSSLALLAITNSTLHAENSGLYLGLGYSSTNIDLKVDTNFNKDTLLDEATNSLLLLAGYDFNDYIGVEGRYYLNNSSVAFDYYLENTPLAGTYKAETLTLYAKPQYTMGLITVYGLLGVASNDYTVTNLSGVDNDTLFSWGAGAKLNITESFGAFLDYTDFGDSDSIVTNNLTSWNVGISYKF